MLDTLPVVGAGNLTDGTLYIDLVCANWDKRFEDDWIPEYKKDYFLEAIVPENADGIRPDIAELINSDINCYRDYMIRQYNGNTEKATDEFCFKKFLNEYSTAINVFGLHSEFNCKSSFNRFINYCWQVVNGNGGKEKEVIIMKIKDKPNKIKAKLIVEIEGEFYDDEANEESLRYNVEQDLKDTGYNVIDVSVM
jgi:hypothetical protein